MNKIVINILLCLIGIVLILLVAFLIKIFLITDTVSDNVIIATIGALTATITIVSSVYMAKQASISNAKLSKEASISSAKIAQQTAISNAKLQRDMDARKIKQEFYHTFLEALSVKFSHINNMTTKEAIEANKTFCIENNRLPLYASQDIVEMINLFAKGGKPPEFTELYELVRKDLCSDSYHEFIKLKQIHFQIPNNV